MHRKVLSIVMFTVFSVFIHFYFSINVQADSWEYKEPMPTPRLWSVTAIVGGKIYVIGGHDGSSRYLKTVEAYDPIADQWTTGLNLMATPRAYFTASSANGKIYVFGGNTTPTGRSDTNLVEEYDPATDEWTFKASMPFARHGHTSQEIDGKIYVVNGREYTTNKDEVWEYDPFNDTWNVNKQHMPVKKAMMSSAVLNGKMFIPAGTSTVADWNTLHVYNPLNDIWETKENLLYGRNYAATAALNRKLYVIGGWLQAGGGEYRTEIVEQYDPDFDTWIEKKNLPEKMADFTNSAVVYNGKIYIFGGSSDSVAVTDTVLEYTPNHPLAIKEEAIEKLEALLIQDPGDDDLIQAIGYINMSLGEDDDRAGQSGSDVVWGDDNHVDACHEGNKGVDVFQYEQEACDKLDAYLENDENADYDFEDEIEEVRKKLADADEMLAATAITDADANGGNPDDRAVAEALKAEGDAAKELGGSEICDVALDKYEESWEKAVKSWCEEE